MGHAIVPGYDFGQTEIPTQANFFQMTAGMTITGVDQSYIDSAVIGIKSEDSAVSLPSEGWLWLGPDGSLWVNTRWGPSRVYRANWGGQETKRYMVGNDIRAAYRHPIDMWEPGFRIRFQGSTDNTEPSSVHLQHDYPINGDNYLAKHLDTAVSGAHCNVLLWGYVCLPVSIHAHSFPGTLVYNTVQTYLVGNYPMTGTYHVKGLLFRNLAHPSSSTMKWALAYRPGMPHQQY